MRQGWIKAVTTEELKRKGRAVFRIDGRQIVLFDTHKGIYACNNRCPHEGYPLREGVLDEDCQLTCNWHNWKFDLNTGENQRGGDKLRIYPVDVRSEDVWVEIVDPPREERLTRSFEDLKQAFRKHDYERLARELARIVQISNDPTCAVIEAIGWSHDRMEFGWTHAYAGTADWLKLYDENNGKLENQLMCLLEAMGHMAGDTLRETPYPFADGAEEWNEDAFVDAVEREDEATALRLTRGAITTGDAFGTMEHGLARAALAHYNNFGHTLIYIPKAGALIQRLGEAVAEPLLLSLVRGFVTAFREDLIPEFAAYREALRTYGTRTNGAAPPASELAGLNIAKVTALVARHGSAPPLDQFRSLLVTNAMNMLTFDLKHLDDLDQPYGSDWGWLDLTHGLTFADAVHTICSKYPELWPAGLLQMACFAGRNMGHADPNIDLEDWRVVEPDTFIADLTQTLLDHGQAEYIVSVHLLKTTQAIRSLLDSVESDSAAETMLAALNRLLQSPLRRKMVRRTARQAMRFVKLDI